MGRGRDKTAAAEALAPEAIGDVDVLGAVLRELSVNDWTAQASIESHRALAEPDKAVVDSLLGMSEAEAGAVLQELLRRSRSVKQSRWDEAVDELIAHPPLEADQLFQAQQYASLKRWVIDHVELLEPGDLARLMPERVGSDTNTARVVEQLRKRGELLAVPYKRGWRYPASQIDSRGRVHTQLLHVIRRAVDQGYEPWEIVFWLARPVITQPDAAVGIAPEGDRQYASLEDAWLAASADAPTDASTEDPTRMNPSPFDRLAVKDVDGFDAAVTQWLGADEARPLAATTRAG